MEDLGPETFCVSLYMYTSWENIMCTLIFDKKCFLTRPNTNRLSKKNFGLGLVWEVHLGLIKIVGTICHDGFACSSNQLTNQQVS